MMGPLFKCYKSFLTRQLYHYEVLKEARYEHYHILISRLSWKCRIDSDPNHNPSFLLWTASKMRIWAHHKRIFWVAYSWVLFFCSSCFISILGKPVARTKDPSASLSIKQCTTGTIPVYLWMLAPTYREFKMQTVLYLNQKIYNMCACVCILPATVNLGPP